MLFVIHSIFQNMRVNLLLIEPGDTLLRKSMCRVQSRMIIFQNVFPVALKNSGSQKRIFLLTTII